jgi:zinc/manganese transport system substrate-binding protein
MILRSASRRRLLVVAAVAPLLVAPAWAADRVDVVATFSVIGDMIAQVGGNHLDIKTIVGPGGDSELYLSGAILG